MDQNKNDEHANGGPPVNSQHHLENTALSLQKKIHSSDFTSLNEDQRSVPGASSGRTTHGLSGAEINKDSLVINGDVRGKHQDTAKTHIITGGSVSHNSVLCNGDLNLESLMKILGKKC